MFTAHAQFDAGSSEEECKKGKRFSFYARSQLHEFSGSSDFLDRHEGQMNDYRAVVAARYGLDPTRISVSLIRVEDAAVVEVPPPEAG